MQTGTSKLDFLYAKHHFCLPFCLLTNVNRLSLAEFRQLVLAKIAPTVFNPKRLAWILSFIPPMIELRRCSNKEFFWDALILHALETPAELPVLPVLERSKLDLGIAITHLKHHFQDDRIIFCTALINVHPSLIFDKLLYDQVQTFHRRSHFAVMQQIELFWIHLEDPKSPERVAIMREKKRVTQQANRAQKSPEKLSDMREKDRERTRSIRAAMSPEKASKEQEMRRDRQRNLTAQKVADIKEYIQTL